MSQACLEGEAVQVVADFVDRLNRTNGQADPDEFCADATIELSAESLADVLRRCRQAKSVWHKPV